MKRSAKNTIKKLDTVVLSFAFFLIVLVLVSSMKGSVTGNVALDIMKNASNDIVNPFSAIDIVLGADNSVVGKTKKIDALNETVNETKNMTVHFIDVGHGDAILIQTPNNANVLIDSGYPDTKGNVSAYLKSLGVNYLDAAISTHPDEDHIGGMSWILGKMKYVYYVIDNGQATDSLSYIKYEKRKTKGKENFSLMEDRTLLVDDDISFDAYVAYTNESYLNGTNANSIVIRVQYGDVSFLFTGDCNIECEQKIMEKRMDVDADILKVGHHGANDSTSQEFLEAVSPEVAVISTGHKESFGHPHDEVVERLKDAGIEVLRTDYNSTIRITTDGFGYWYDGTRTAQQNESKSNE